MTNGQTQKPVKAVGYVRGADTDQQRESITRHCATKGYNVVRIYSDDVAGVKVGQQFTELVKDAESNHFDVVVAQSIDRISRLVSNVAVQFQELERMGVKLEIVSA